MAFPPSKPSKAPRPRPEVIDLPGFRTRYRGSGPAPAFRALPGLQAHGPGGGSGTRPLTRLDSTHAAGSRRRAARGRTQSSPSWRRPTPLLLQLARIHPRRGGKKSCLLWLGFDVCAGVPFPVPLPSSVATLFQHRVHPITRTGVDVPQVHSWYPPFPAATAAPAPAAHAASSLGTKITILLFPEPFKKDFYS